MANNKPLLKGRGFSCMVNMTNRIVFVGFGGPILWAPQTGQFLSILADCQLALDRIGELLYNKGVSEVQPILDEVALRLPVGNY